MGINKGKFVNKAKIYAAMFILFAAMVVDIVFINTLEKNKRQQARYNLEHTINCFAKYENNKDKLDAYGLKCCTEKMRTTITGDMYVLDINSLKFLYDGSADVPKDLYFTKESIGKYFTEWNTAVKALKLMTTGNDSVAMSRASYNFDGSEEWLEFKNYSTKDNKNILVVQGIQSDEAKEGFLYLRGVSAILILIYVTWLISTSIIIKKD